MESLTPLFKCMTEGIHRLERQEQQEEADAEKARKDVQGDAEAEALKKQPTTLDSLARRARRLTIRLATMANRCFWLSAAEVTVHILTSGDCLQSHNNVRIFTRQLQWAMQQCKRQLNNEAPEAPTERPHQNVQTVSVHIQGDDGIDGVAKCGARDIDG